MSSSVKEVQGVGSTSSRWYSFHLSLINRICLVFEVKEGDEEKDKEEEEEEEKKKKKKKKKKKEMKKVMKNKKTK